MAVMLKGPCSMVGPTIGKCLLWRRNGYHSFSAVDAVQAVDSQTSGHGSHCFAQTARFALNHIISLSGMSGLAVVPRRRTIHRERSSRGRPSSSMTWLWLNLRARMIMSITRISVVFRLRRVKGNSYAAFCCGAGGFAGTLPAGVCVPVTGLACSSPEALEGASGR